MYPGVSTAANKILIIADDHSVQDSIGLALERENFTPIFAGIGEVLEQLFATRPQILLVDLPLSPGSGLELCKQIQSSGLQTPIIFLSTAWDEFDRVLLLETGADDCIVKPFYKRELVARIRAVHRRSARHLERPIRFGDVEVDLERRNIRHRGDDVKVTPAEYNLLRFFLHNADRVLTRDAILNSAWGYDCYPNTRTVDAHVVRLRQKLEPNPSAPRHFLTVHGVGYRFLIEPVKPDAGPRRVA
jgi:DNA-binding response OmpR family regulator